MKIETTEYNKTKTNGRSDLVLPEIDVKKTVGVKFVSKAVSLTFLILLGAAVIAMAVILTVDMEITLEANGVLEPYKIKQIHSPQSALIKDILIESGDTVSFSQPLAVLDSTELRRNLNEIRTEIRTQQNNLNSLIAKNIYQERENEILLKQSEAMLIRSKAAFRERLLDYYPGADPDSIYDNYVPGSHITLDYAMAEIKSGEYEVENRKLKQEMIELNDFEIEKLKITLDKYKQQEKDTEEKLSKVVIKSPLGGIVLTENIDKLEETFVSEGSLLFEISDIKEWTALLFVNEIDIHEVKPGNKVKIELQALQAVENIEMIEAEVISIAAEQNTQNENYSGFSGLYRVTAKLNLSQHEKLVVDKLKHGYNVTGFIITDQDIIYKLLLKYFKKL